MISNPKEFLIKVIEVEKFCDLLPYVIQQARTKDLKDYEVRDAACEAMILIAFHPVFPSGVKRPDFAYLHCNASKEQIQVITEAAECLGRMHTSIWNLQEIGIPYDERTCKEFLAEARVMEDLYGYA